MTSRREFLAGSALAGVLPAARYQPTLIFAALCLDTGVPKGEDFAWGTASSGCSLHPSVRDTTGIELINALLGPELRGRTTDLVRQYEFNVWPPLSLG